MIKATTQESCNQDDDDVRHLADGKETGAKTKVSATIAVEKDDDGARNSTGVKSEDADGAPTVAVAAALSEGAAEVIRNDGGQDKSTSAAPLATNNDDDILLTGEAASALEGRKNEPADHDDDAAAVPPPRPAPATRTSSLINNEPPTVHRANAAHAIKELAANSSKAKANIEDNDQDSSHTVSSPVSSSTLAQQKKKVTPSKKNNAPSSPPIVNLGIGHRINSKQEEGIKHPLVSATPGGEKDVGTPSSKVVVVASSSRSNDPKGSSGGSTATSTSAKTASKAVPPTAKTKQHTASKPAAESTSANDSNPDDSLSRTWSETIFPMKLYDILCNPDFHHAISWMPHGRSWRVINKEFFMAEICPQYFAQTRYESFIRQVNGWGFKRMRREGSDRSSYYHEHFLRGYPNMIDHMRRPAPGEKNRDVREEPDFCAAPPMPQLPPVDPNHRMNKMMVAMAYPQQQLHPHPFPQHQQGTVSSSLVTAKKVGRPAGSTGMRSAAGGIMLPPLPPENVGGSGLTRMSHGSFDAVTPRGGGVGGASAEGGEGPGGAGGMAGYYMPYQAMPPMSPAYGGGHAGGGYHPHLGYPPPPPPPPMGYPGYPSMQPPGGGGGGGGVGPSPEYYGGGPPESPWRQHPGPGGWHGGPFANAASSNAESAGASSSSSRGPGGVAEGGVGAPLPPHMGAMPMGYPWSPPMFGDPSQYYAHHQFAPSSAAAGGGPPTTPNQRVLSSVGVKREYENDEEEEGEGVKRQSYEVGRGGGSSQHPPFSRIGGSPTGGHSGGEHHSDMAMGWYPYPGGGGPMMISDPHHHPFMMQSSVSAAAAAAIANAERREGQQGEEEGSGEQGTHDPGSSPKGYSGY